MSDVFFNGNRKAVEMSSSQYVRRPYNSRRPGMKQSTSRKSSRSISLQNPIDGSIENTEDLRFRRNRTSVRKHTSAPEPRVHVSDVKETGHEQAEQSTSSVRRVSSIRKSRSLGRAAQNIERRRSRSGDPSSHSQYAENNSGETLEYKSDGEKEDNGEQQLGSTGSPRLNRSSSRRSAPNERRRGRRSDGRNSSDRSTQASPTRSERRSSKSSDAKSDQNRSRTHENGPTKPSSARRMRRTTRSKPNDTVESECTHTLPNDESRQSVRGGKKGPLSPRVGSKARKTTTESVSPSLKTQKANIEYHDPSSSTIGQNDADARRASESQNEADGESLTSAKLNASQLTVKATPMTKSSPSSGSRTVVQINGRSVVVNDDGTPVTPIQPTQENAFKERSTRLVKTDVISRAIQGQSKRLGMLMKMTNFKSFKKQNDDMISIASDDGDSAEEWTHTFQTKKGPSETRGGFDNFDVMPDTEVLSPGADLTPLEKKGQKVPGTPSLNPRKLWSKVSSSRNLPIKSGREFKSLEFDNSERESVDITTDKYRIASIEEEVHDEQDTTFEELSGSSNMFNTGHLNQSSDDQRSKTSFFGTIDTQNMHASQKSPFHSEGNNDNTVGTGPLFDNFNNKNQRSSGTWTLEDFAQNQETDPFSDRRQNDRQKESSDDIFFPNSFATDFPSSDQFETTEDGDHVGRLEPLLTVAKQEKKSLPDPSICEEKLKSGTSGEAVQGSRSHSRALRSKSEQANHSEGPQNLDKIDTLEGLFESSEQQQFSALAEPSICEGMDSRARAALQSQPDIPESRSCDNPKFGELNELEDEDTIFDDSSAADSRRQPQGAILTTSMAKKLSDASQSNLAYCEEEEDQFLQLNLPGVNGHESTKSFAVFQHTFTPSG